MEKKYPSTDNQGRADCSASPIANKSYLLLSGGQDSFACLLWAREKFADVDCVSIDYGQRHAIELEQAQQIATFFQMKHSVYDIASWMKTLSVSALTDDRKNINAPHSLVEHLPASFVPARNGILLTILATHAYNQIRSGDANKVLHLIIGACQTDYSGYPDCRDNYIKAKGIELSYGLDCQITIHTPLMWQNKAETFAMIDRYGELSTCLRMTITCYEGNLTENDFGLGCGKCNACLLRKKGYADFVKHSKHLI